jgi:Arc/MetJ-type ribon-helix-helix transcriptional regulator
MRRASCAPPESAATAVGYDPGMTTKIAVSLPDEQVSALKQAVRDGRAPSVSALVSAALADKLQGEELAALVADLIAQDGAPSDDDYAWARSALGL